MKKTTRSFCSLILALRLLCSMLITASAETSSNTGRSTWTENGVTYNLVVVMDESSLETMWSPLSGATAVSHTQYGGNSYAPIPASRSVTISAGSISQTSYPRYLGEAMLATGDYGMYISKTYNYDETGSTSAQYMIVDSGWPTGNYRAGVTYQFADATWSVNYYGVRSYNETGTITNAPTGEHYFIAGNL